MARDRDRARNDWRLAFIGDRIPELDGAGMGQCGSCVPVLGPLSGERWRSAEHWLAGLGPFGSCAITLIGLWKTTLPEFASWYKRLFGLRGLICSGHAAQCVLSAATTYLVLTSAAAGRPLGIGLTLHVMSSLIAACVFSASLLYGLRLARRVSDRRLARRTLGLLVAMIVCGVLMCVGCLYAGRLGTWLGSPGMPRSSYDHGEALLGVMTAASLLASLIAIISVFATLFLRMEGFFLVLSYRKAFITASGRRNGDVTSS